jgi:2-keto-4-pentenoate hydratase/2-oxohepta-3-ene-1,7-dioic acid hydratase in catechol pathway
MRVCRFEVRDNAHVSSPGLYGQIEGDEVRELTGPPWQGGSVASGRWKFGQVRLLAPVEPSKVVCVGRNYAAHAAELGNEIPKEPLIFLKPPSSIVGPDEPIVLTPLSQRVEHEGELALVVGRKCAHLRDSDDALSYLAGYACLNDVTARDIQKSDVQFTRGKGFDTFCPIGPWIETQLDPANVLVELRVNGGLRQTGRTSLMLYPCAYLVRWLSRMMTLLPGDVIATGTPAGVGPLVAGDLVEVSVEGVGVLRNPVHAPQS